MSHEMEPSGDFSGKEPVSEPDREPQTAEEWARYFADQIIEERYQLADNGWIEEKPALQGNGDIEVALRSAADIEITRLLSVSHEERKENFELRAAVEGSKDAMKDAQREGAKRGYRFQIYLSRFRNHLLSIYNQNLDPSIVIQQVRDFVNTSTSP